MVIDMTAVIFPGPGFMLDGIEHNSEPVDVRRLTGEHVLSGPFGFRQMTPDDYIWVRQQEQAELEAAAALHEQEAIDAYTEELLKGGLL